MPRALVLGLALVAAGCGDAPSAAPISASATPGAAAVRGVLPQPRARFGAGVRRQLAAGGVAVVDFRARVAIAPATLTVNREQTLEEVRWSGWGRSRTMGRARVRTLVCDPTCAQGRIAYARGTLELSGVRTCGARRYYAAARLRTRDPESGRPATPATFLRTPC